MKYLALDIGNVTIAIEPWRFNRSLGLESFPEEYAALLQQVECGEISQNLFFQKVQVLLEKKYGLSCSQEELSRHFEENLREVMPGMPALLRRLMQFDVQPVFFSDISPAHRAETLRIFPEAEKFPGIFSYQVGAWKPSEKMFRAFEEKYGSPVLYLDDRFPLICAALRHGWEAYRFRDAAASETVLMEKLKRPLPSALEILEHFYPEDTPLRRLLLQHSRQVRDKALEILTQAPPEIQEAVREDVVAKGAMLHDVGICRCHAPGILCNGSEPYLAHGVIGAQMLRSWMPALEPYARICERHTGTGITAMDIRRQQLPLPEKNYFPETLEEKLVCLADKFFSKSGDLREKPLEMVRAEMARFGEENLQRFQELRDLFGVNAQ